RLCRDCPLSQHSIACQRSTSMHVPALSAIASRNTAARCEEKGQKALRSSARNIVEQRSLPSRELEEEMEGEPIHVLVVEDDPLVRAIVVEALRDEGFQVSEASNAQEALEACLDKVADVLFTD